MNEVVQYSFDQVKEEIRKELTSTAQSVCRIGFLLKIVRDGTIQNSGYADVNEFAKKEYGLDKSQVSRFIRINDRFSVDGYSEQLRPEYIEYGSAKLSVMLMLPDEINEELSPEYSKSDIQTIKEEYEAEQKITELEVMLEGKDNVPDEFIEAVVKQLNDEHPEPINSIHFMVCSGWGIDADKIKEAYTPAGECTYNIRISGQGRYMVNCREAGITIVNMRDPGNKTPLSWEAFLEAVMADEKTRTFKEKKEPEEKPKPKKVEKSKQKQKEEVAPVQQHKEQPENNTPAAGAETVAEDTESVAEDIKTVAGDQTPAAGVEILSPAAGVEKVAGEVIESPEITKELTDLEEQVIHDLRKIIEEIRENVTDWGNVKDQLYNIVHRINRR